MKTPEIIVKGKDNGDSMIIHYQTTKGTDIFGLGMTNFHGSGEWDLGPTWCYLIPGQKTTLIDTGRYEYFDDLVALLKLIDIDVADIGRVIPTHSHEDHDGNLAEVVASSGAELWAHEIYPCMISYHPDLKEGVPHPDLPGSCRLCVMPDEFRHECLSYHQRRSKLRVDYTIKDYQSLPDENISFVHTPGHTVDSICIVLEDEVMFTGDTLLPDITPHPSRAYAFDVNRLLLPVEYSSENTIYGLMVYIKSLNKITSLPSQPLEAIFPAHRLFYNGKFNLIHSSSDRARQIIQFHIDRCRDILRITDEKPMELENIAFQHFAPELLSGGGLELAKVELIAHIEIMQECGDISWAGDNMDMVQYNGSENYLKVLEAYLQ